MRQGACPTKDLLSQMSSLRKVFGMGIGGGGIRGRGIGGGLGGLTVWADSDLPHPLSVSCVGLHTVPEPNHKEGRKE